MPTGLLIDDPIQKSNGKPVDLTGQEGVKASLDYNSTSDIINASLNVSSVVDSGTGKADVSFTNTFLSSGYPCTAAAISQMSHIGAKTASILSTRTRNGGDTLENNTSTNLMATGDLA